MKRKRFRQRPTVDHMFWFAMENILTLDISGTYFENASTKMIREDEGLHPIFKGLARSYTKNGAKCFDRLKKAAERNWLASSVR
jgi:hypothetical protein